MFIRQCHRVKNGRRHAYWALVESYRRASGPRQRVIAWLGNLGQAGRLGVRQTAEAVADGNGAESASTVDRSQPLGRQMRFEFDDDASAVTPRWVEVNAAGVRVETLRQFRGPWMALHLIRTLQLDTLLSNAIPKGRELVGWDISSLILIIARLLEPASELFAD